MDLELCQIYEQTEEDKLSGRVRFKLSGLEVCEEGNYDDCNDNGIHWEEKNVVAQIDTCINMPVVVHFITNEFNTDEENRTYISDHGSFYMTEDGQYSFPDSTVVGTCTSAYIDTVAIENADRKVLVVEGIIYAQRYYNMVQELKRQMEDGYAIKCSIEISPKKIGGSIEYENKCVDENGNLVRGRSPKDFQFSGIALLSTYVRPADMASELLEINQSKEDSMADVNKNEKPELNSVSVDKVIRVIEEAADEKFDKWMYVYTLLLDEKCALLHSCEMDSLDFIKVDYTIENDEITLGEFEEVKLTVTPAKAEEKIVELNAAIVNATRQIEEQTVELNALKEEIVPLREEKARAEQEAKQLEVNNYFETIKNKNGFTEVELNSLKEEYVDKCDLAGLKAKEVEICANKYLESLSIEKETVELNSAVVEDNTDLFFSTKQEPVKEDIIDGSMYFHK